MTLIATALVIALLSVGLTLLKIRRDVTDAALGSSLLTVGGAVLISITLVNPQIAVLLLGNLRVPLGNAYIFAYYVPLGLGILLAVMGGGLTFGYIRRYRQHRQHIEKRLQTDTKPLV